MSAAFSMLSATQDVLDTPQSQDIFNRLYRRVARAHPFAEVVADLDCDLLSFLDEQGLLEREGQTGACAVASQAQPDKEQEAGLRMEPQAQPRQDDHKENALKTVGPAWHKPAYNQPKVLAGQDYADIAVAYGRYVPKLHTGAVEFTFAGSRVRLYRAGFYINTDTLEPYVFEAMVDLTTGKRTVPYQVLTAKHQASYKAGPYTWVFDRCWSKSYDMYKAIKETKADDLILDEGQRSSLERDTRTFFSSEKLYKQLEAPWQRGILLLGPPGNGKTTAIRAILSNLEQRVLVVQNTDTPNDVGSIFSTARDFAPCVLLLEDLDSLVKKTSLSLILNELDGITPNHGLLIIASTNHPERLDPALLSRPSRFDTKYTFGLPDEELRYRYLLRWLQRKYATALQLGGKYGSLEPVARQLAKETEGFPFSLLKELFISFALERASGAWGDPGAPVAAEHLFERARALAPLFITAYAREGEDNASETS